MTKFHLSFSVELDGDNIQEMLQNIKSDIEDMIPRYNDFHPKVPKGFKHHIGIEITD